LGDVVILPVIPLSSSEVEDKTVVRGLLDLAAWYESLQDPVKTVPDYQEGVGGYLPIGKKSRGPGWADYRINIAMSVSLYQGAGTIPSTSGSWVDRPTRVARWLWPHNSKPNKLNVYIRLKHH
jgi:hypothetical protein